MSTIHTNQNLQARVRGDFNPSAPTMTWDRTGGGTNKGFQTKNAEAEVDSDDLLAWCDDALEEESDSLKAATPISTGNSNHHDPGTMGSTSPSNLQSHENSACGTTTEQNQEEEEEQEVEQEDTELERRRLEEEESIALARQIMAEEALTSYAMSSNFLRDNADQYSDMDLAALEAAMAEEDPLAQVDDDAEGEEEDAELSYDAMLRLGERIGNVKEERWAIVSSTHIEKLPTFKFSPSMAEGKEENHTERKCQVCQCEYEAEEDLRRLPCGHCFHTDCVDIWLATKDSCPFCRKCILQDEIHD